MREYLLSQKQQLEKRIQYEKSVDAKLTVSILERELEVINLAIAGLDAKCPGCKK